MKTQSVYMLISSAFSTLDTDNPIIQPHVTYHEIITTTTQAESDSSMSPSCYLPSQKALLLLDYMNLNVDVLPIEKTSALLPRTPQLRDWTRGDKVLIAHCLISTAQDPEPQQKINERWPLLFDKIKENPSAMHEVDVLLPKAATEVEYGERGFTFHRKIGLFSALLSDGLLDF